MVNSIDSANSDEVCVCPKCGYAVLRLAGTKCSDVSCPKCNIPLKLK